MERGKIWYSSWIFHLLLIKQDMERRKERDEISKNKFKASFCSTDILSKMFGPTYQEGEGYAEGDKHILVNAFPQEGEGHRVL